MTLPGWRAEMIHLGGRVDDGSHFGPGKVGVWDRHRRWVVVNPGTRLEGERWCPDCGAELQRAVVGTLHLLRCPWTYAGERMQATAPIWGCGRPFKRSGGS